MSTAADRPAQPSLPMSETAPVLVVGDLEAARLTCGALRDLGTRTRHVVAPTEEAVREALAEPLTAAAVLVRGDVTALRLALLVEHLRPGIRLVVTVFDRTVAEHLQRVVPNCQVTSPAEVSVPAIAAACLDDGALAIQRRGNDVVRWIAGPEGAVATPYAGIPSRLRQWLGWLRPTMRHPGGTGLLIGGLSGLAAILVADWLLSIAVLHESVPTAFYSAAKVLATVGPASADTHAAPSWYLVVTGLFMLAAMALIAVFTAGLVDWLLSTRSVAFAGPRRLPRADHVIVSGLGQVGLRLAVTLRRIGIPVVVVERVASAPGVALAHELGIPVVIGDAVDRSTLLRVGLQRARALAVMGSDDLGNVEVSIAALAVVPDARVVLRAGEGDVVTETRSLFHIGPVVDVSALTAATAALSVLERQPAVVVPSETGSWAIGDGEVTELPRATRCRC